MENIYDLITWIYYRWSICFDGQTIWWWQDKTIVIRNIFDCNIDNWYLQAKV